MAQQLSRCGECPLLTTSEMPQREHMLSSSSCRVPRPPHKCARASGQRLPARLRRTSPRAPAQEAETPSSSAERRPALARRLDAQSRSTLLPWVQSLPNLLDDLKESPQPFRRVRRAYQADLRSDEARLE